MLTTTHLAVIAAAAALCSAATSALMLEVAPRLALPVGPRSNNPCHQALQKYKPGGVAVLIASLGAILSIDGLGLLGGVGPLGAAQGLSGREGGLVLAAVLAFVAIGWVDDHAPFTPGGKLMLQTPVALVAVLALGGSPLLPQGPGWVALEVAWIVVLTNTFNIIDVADGLLPGVAAVVLAALGALLLVQGQLGLAVVASAFAGGLAGFLPLNVHPGRLILGDTGSLMVGGLIALLVSRIDWAAPSLGLDAGLAVLAFALLEVVWVSTRRLAAGIAPWRASPHHFVYGLVSQGLSSPGAVLVITTAQTAALLLVLSPTLSGPWLACPLATLALLSVGVLRHRLGGAGIVVTPTRALSGETATDVRA